MKKLFLLLASAALLILAATLLSNCGTPVTVGVSSDYGSATYSEKGGLGLVIDASAIERRMSEPRPVTVEK